MSPAINARYRLQSVKERGKSVQCCDEKASLYSTRTPTHRSSLWALQRNSSSRSPLGGANNFSADEPSLKPYVAHDNNAGHSNLQLKTILWEVISWIHIWSLERLDT